MLRCSHAARAAETAGRSVFAARMHFLKRNAVIPQFKQNGSQSATAKSQSATAKRCAALSSRRQDLIDQPIVRCFERIDKSNARQFKAILEVLGKQMANAGPLCGAP
jgi:hypothetical protein